MIRVQREDFDVGAELDRLTGTRTDVGGVSVFIGRVRGSSGGEHLDSLELDHYPGMTERHLKAIDTEAHCRWPLAATLIIHRYGRLAPGEQIVLVAVAAQHRREAFAACEFLIDWLKTKAPFWKVEEAGGSRRWVAATADDDAAASRWERDATPVEAGR